MLSINLGGKVAIVTGASRGIGFECARLLSECGASVAMVATNQQRLDEAKSKLPGKVSAYICDLKNTADVSRTVEQVSKDFGKIDILVNNAGVTKDNIAMRMNDDEWNQVLETNLRGPFAMMRACVRQMLRQRSGRIINVASVSGMIGVAGQANYSSAKAGLIALTKVVARELGSKGIYVNAVAPGFVETDMTGQLPEQYKTETLRAINLGRFAKPSEIANVVLFLCSDLASYIQGTTIVVDGGMTMI